MKSLNVFVPSTLHPPPSDTHTLPDVTKPPSNPLSLFLLLSFFIVEFLVSPFQTFFNSGIKAAGAEVGWGVGIGEIRPRDPPGIV